MGRGVRDQDQFDLVAVARVGGSLALGNDWISNRTLEQMSEAWEGLRKVPGGQGEASTCTVATSRARQAAASR
jgi:hypothetical protein